MLLSLPPEILIQISCILAPIDVLSFQFSNKHLYNTIRDSIDVQYHVALKSSSYEDNTYSSVPIADKLHALKERQRAWRLVKPRFITSIKLPPHSLKYQLLAGVVFLADFERNSIHFMRLPSKENDKPQWEKMTTSSAVIEFCPVVEYDLIILVTTNAQSGTDGQTLYRIEIELYQLSTGKVHPHAACSRVFVMNAPSDKPNAYVRIVGDNLVPVFSFRGHRNEDDQIFVFNWRSGELRANWHAPHNSISTCLFLSEDIVVIPNKVTNSLDIFRIPTRPGVSPVPLLVLSLPKVASGYAITYFFPRVKPDPFTSPSHWLSRNVESSKRLLSTSDFFAKEGETISIFQLVIDSIWGRRSIFSFVMQTEALLELVETCGQEGSDHCEPIIMPYSLWGTSTTRWFGTNEYANTWLASSWGHRYVQIKHPHNMYEGVPIIMMDFNPQRVKAWQDAHRDDNAGESGTSCVSSVDIVRPPEIFEELVRCGLPYLVSRSEALYAFDGVMMDDERILGVRDNPSGVMENIDVLHFG